MVAIRDCEDLPTSGHKSVLYSLATRGKNCYPNQKQLMKDSRVGNRNTLTKIIKDLETLGWITVTKKKHGSNQYKNNRYLVHIPTMNNECTSSEQIVFKDDTLKINKDKRKINISIENQGKAGLKYKSLSSFGDDFGRVRPYIDKEA